MRFLVIAGALLLVGCAGPAMMSQQEPAAPAIPMASPADLRELTVAEKAVLAKAFAGGLKDPGSAQFRWTQFPKKPVDGAIDYCAMVNAKNSYGGYIGFQPFLGIVEVKKGKIVGGAIGAVGDNNPVYQDILPKMCREKGLDPFAVKS